MINRKIAILMALVLCLTYTNFVGYNKECKASILPKFYVDDDYDDSTPGWNVDHFSTIQEAIDASNYGDRIVVYEGSYNENILIDHKIDLFGEDKEITIIEGLNSGHTINISASGVNISHFTIKESGTSNDESNIYSNAGNLIITDNVIKSGGNGVYLANCNNNIIYDNEIESNVLDGIHLLNSDSNEITYNKITNNDNGLFLYDSSDNEISHTSQIKNNDINGIFLNETSNSNQILYNNISSNTHNGIFLNDHCEGNEIENNDIYSNTKSGIRLENSSSNTMENNNVNSNTDYGIMIVGSSNIVNLCTIKNNNKHGIFLFADDHNTIKQNMINSNTKAGIHLSNSSNDTIHTNKIKNNNLYGTYIDYFSRNNLLYNNLFYSNNINAIDKSINKNKWNTSKRTGSNIAGGSYICGNFWSDYSEDISDSNNDDIADDSYTVNGPNIDYGPLIDGENPVLGPPTISESEQTIGSNTRLSVDITDNIEVSKVYLVLTKPNGAIENSSIKQNKTGNIYYCEKAFSPVGNFSFYILAKDSINWERSVTKTFEITEGTAPQVTDNSPSSGEAGFGFLFNATVTDDTDSADNIYVEVVWSHGEKSGTLELDHKNNNYFQVGVSLDDTTGKLTYYFVTNDTWGNTKTTDSTSIDIIDETKPVITINSHEYESDGFIHTYEISTTITDNAKVSSSHIEYWINNGTHNKALMDKNGNNYEKTIYLEKENDKVFCIINATDPSGNEVDTKNPYAYSGGSYTGVISNPVTFNASNSFDLDGEIVSYNWDFGDGSTGSGKITEHTYYTNGEYDVTLTVTDNEDLKEVDTTTSTIVKADKTKPSSTLLNNIEEEYGVEFTEYFYCYDIDGDDKEDNFYDPNGVLETVHSNSIDIDNATCFILKPKSTNNMFLWNVDEDSIITVNTDITITNTFEQNTENKVYVNLTIEKEEGWIYFETEDKYPNSAIDVYSENSIIPSDRFWRENNKIYVLDDPPINYSFVYDKKDVSGSLQWISFNPPHESNISISNPTIEITYNVPVTITKAEFYDYSTETTKDIINDLETNDNKVYTYTPQDISKGQYDILIHAEDSKGTVWKNWSLYNYVLPSTEEQESKFNIFTFLPFIGIIAGAAVALYLLMRFKNIAFESFIYIKDKKIIPFFKPLVFGPLRLNIDEKNIQKAEFYVNGQLRNTINEPPYIWNFDEKGIMKPTIEAKVYDNKGNTSSTGEMTFYVFNRFIR